ncbi:MAG: malate synthase G [Candidatus Puniceispirillales bacterium]
MKNIKYKLPNGKISNLKGKSLLLIRNVGHLMKTSSILDKNRNEIGEGIVDTLLTSLCYLKTMEKSSNSKFKSLYIVKPKMHGPEEVKFSVDTFSLFEKFLYIPRNTIKIGIMDEERRTTLNLKECIRVAKERVFFINTGFLDRTGDEIHTSMEAGVMVKKTEMKNLNWINAYEKWNVKTGLSCGFSGFAQIGKGMWAMPDMMDKMIDEKINHCKSGANTAWVPSPTAATLHALHYHEINVFNLHNNIAKNIDVKFDDLLDLPIINKPNWTQEEIQNELDNNIQSILGYVVKWINNGIGCSKVPDINNINLMEDRATLRISSQHVSNWLKYNICNKQQVVNTFKKMALIVDKQNKTDVNYIPMSNNFDNSIAFKAACNLVLDGLEQPSGYTEPILHAERLNFKKKFNII